MTDVFLAHPDAPEELRQRFIAACNTRSSIHELLTVLRDTASGLDHITELGVGDGWSTLAWLLVQPRKLVCVDLGWQAIVPDLDHCRGRTEFVFLVAHSHHVELEPTDLLFIDTIHTYDHLKEELRLHADRARKFLVFHDTTTFGEMGEDRRRPGIWRAIEELLERDHTLRVHTRLTHCNGLTILQRQT